MAYTDNKAAGRDNLTAKFDDSVANKNGSNQLRMQGVPTRNLNASSRPDAGNQVRLQGNSKQTGVVKQPSAKDLNGKRKTLAATTNPDGAVNRPTGKTAAKK